VGFLRWAIAGGRGEAGVATGTTGVSTGIDDVVPCAASILADNPAT
jgi:hypothetical protein